MSDPSAGVAVEEEVACAYDGVYRGNKATTVSGRKCQPWAKQTPHKHTRTAANYPGKGLDANYCRNPDGEPEGNWCYTDDPEVRWEYCGIEECAAECAENIASYRGKRDVTETGRQCQPWTSQSPQTHTKTTANYPDAGLEANYCRNPDGEPEGAWCYTTDTEKRWEYCGIPICKVGCAYGGVYRGDVSVTESGRTCQAWNKQSPQAHSWFSPEKNPNDGLDSNYCRNPSANAGGNWCYTTDSAKRWEHCDIPDCGVEVAALSTAECSSGDSTAYRGTKAVTSSGKTCQAWNKQSPHAHSYYSPEKNPNDGLDSNYCRNPSNNAGGTWCYTTDRNTRWENCDIPAC